MPRFLYVFEFQTAAQLASQTGEDEVESSCEAVFIEAESEEMALRWGRRISEAFINHLFPDKSVNWTAQAYPHRIEPDPAQVYPAPILQGLQTVAVGVLPDFGAFKSREGN